MQESQFSQIVTGFLQAPIRNSTFPSGPVLGLSTISATCQPCAVTQSRTSAQTRACTAGDRKSVVLGKSVAVRVDLGGRRILKTKSHDTTTHSRNCYPN